MLYAVMAWAKAKLYTFTHDERGDVNIVSIVVLIGVAVLLALLFKGAIGNLLKSLLNTIGNRSNTIVGETLG